MPTPRNGYFLKDGSKVRKGFPPRPEAERFMDKVAMCPMSGCWFWMGTTCKGYGLFRTGSMADGTRHYEYAHRSAYRLFIGPITQPLVCHRCDVPLCVNPAHLFLGTHKDNTRDMWSKGRSWSPFVKEHRGYA